MRISSSSQPEGRRAVGFFASLLLCVPLLAGAQSTGHEMHMQSMPGMQMPAKPAAKKAPAQKKATAKPVARKPVCQEPSRKDAKGSLASASKCASQREDAAKPKRAIPSNQIDHSKMEGMDHSKAEGADPSNIEAMDHSGMEGMDHSAMEGMNHSKMEGMDQPQMDMGSMNMQGGDPPPDARDPDYSDGLDYGSMRGMDMADDAKRLYVLFDNLEQRHGDDGNAQAVDAQAWYGGDRDKLWLKLDGEHSGGRLGATRTEALWNRAIATYWGAQVGLRHDLGEGSTRDWLAVGVQGLAPYWFDLEATAYLGQSGRTALRLEAEYELLFTQRLVLQPDVEVNLYGKNDPARGIGSGLSDLDVGLRLRYEITRKFAPYGGVVWSRKFGKTADYARTAGEDIQDTQLVAGIRIWF